MFPGQFPGRKPLHDRHGNGFNILLHLFCKLLDEITHQQWNIFSAVPQGRYPDREYVQAVKEITAKFLVRDHLLEIAVSGRYQANVHFSRMRAAQPLKFPLLQYPQQLRLNFNRNVAHFVEEQRALIGEFEPADFLADGAGERSLLMPK